jgi:hypothetical protein
LVDRSRGTTGVLALDTALAEETVLFEGQDVAPDSLAVDRGGRVLLRKLGDNQVWRINDGALAPAIAPQLDGWTSLASSSQGVLVGGFDEAGSYLAALDPDTGAASRLFRTDELISGVWSSPADASVVVSHHPIPEEDPTSGSTLVVLGDAPFQRRLPELTGAASPSLSREGVIYFVDPDRVRLGRVDTRTGDLDWLRDPADLVEAMPDGAVATVNRGDSAVIDTLCVGPA